MNRYDYATQQFIHYNIVDSSGRYNANWAYHLMEDGEGKLWIATCLGGIFVVDKQGLMKSHAEHYVAEDNFSTADGLSGMFINQLIPDREGNVWVLVYNNGIDKINIHSRKVSHLSTDSLTGGNKPNFILCDEKGKVWAGFQGGVLRIDPRNNAMQAVRFDSFSKDEVFSMQEVDDCIWISTSNGFWVVDKASLHARRLNPTSRRFTSMFYDRAAREIYLGDVDGFAVTLPDILNRVPINRPIRTTALYINGKAMESGEEAMGSERKSIRYADHIELDYNQNNFAIEFSDLSYSLEEKNKFVYRLNGVDRDWNLLKANTNRITYTNLDVGSYRWMFDGLKENGGKWDVIGMSLYPQADTWQTMTNDCIANMKDMVTRYGSEVMLCEVGMPWDDAPTGYSFLSTLLTQSKAITQCLGVFYWEPQAYGNWNSYTLGAFDNDGRPTAALDAFGE